jgi:hypothetical protein
VCGYIQCIVPDARTPRVRVADDDDDQGGGGGGDGGHGAAAAVGPSPRVLIVAAIRDAVRVTLTDDALPIAVRGTLESTVALLFGVLGRLHASGVVVRVDVEEDERVHAPVYLRCGDRSVDWRYRAVMFTMEGPWLPRCSACALLRVLLGSLRQKKGKAARFRNADPCIKLVLCVGAVCCQSNARVPQAPDL